MKYNELFELNKNFRPAYIINEEDISYWKLFIPNNPFNEILDCTLKSLTSSLTQEKKSIWVQGTFGTGKSHAGAVIKHLLWDDYENLRDYENVLKIELKEKLKNYRQNNRVFPIVLKGISGITNNKNLILVIEKAVKEALTKNGITVNVKSDFERWIEHVEKNDFLNWDKIISDNQILKMHVNNKDELLLKLKNNDIDILNNLENIISQQNIHFSTSNISNWLSDIADDLKNKGIASSLMIFWDEFTSILELNNAKTILNEIQNIAELLSPQGKVFLYIICHKMVEQAVPLEDVKRIQGRFYPHDYSMTTLTTYHIMSTYIKKKDIKLFESQLHEHINSNPQLLKLISDLANDNCENRMRDIKNLFPIHPYTGYIATYISRYIGSAQRSIFNFLHDSNKGFLKFINENPDTNNNIFLTADWMFDYFFEEFEKDGSEKINYILNHYLNVKNELENNENGYINVFKTIMLLNILHQEVYFGEDIKQLTPTTTNLKRIYLGTNLENQIDDILNFIDSKNFVSKTPDDRFVIHTIGLQNAPEDEEIKKEIEKKYENIVKILDYNPKAIEEFKSFFTTNILRESEINFYSASTNLNQLKTNINKDFKNKFALHFVGFLLKNENEEIEIKKAIENELSKEINNKIFVIFQKPISNEEFKRFITYLSKVCIAERHNNNDLKIEFEKYCNQIIHKWIDKIKQHSMCLYYKNDSRLVVGTSSFNEHINNNFSSAIFSEGFEKIRNLKNSNIWKREVSKSSLELFLFSDSRKNAIEKANKGISRYLLDIVKNNNGTYVIDEKFDFIRENVSEHPLYAIYLQIKDKFEELKSKKTFNLAKEFEIFTKPPFGIYPNKIYISALGLIMRNYIGELYDARTSKVIEREVMRDKIEKLFKYWNSNAANNNYPEDLSLRFGSAEERELSNELKNIFNIQNVDNLKDVLEKIISEIIVKNNMPLWSINLANQEALNEAINKIDGLIKNSNPSDEQIKDTLKDVSSNKIELLRLNVSQFSSNILLKQWVKSNTNFDITDNDFNQIIEDLKMQKKIENWTQQDFKLAIFEWDRIHKSSLNISQNNFSPNDKTIYFNATPTINEFTKKEITNNDVDNDNKNFDANNTFKKSNVKNLKDKILNYNGDLKTVILLIVDKYPHLVEDIEPLIQ